jgi:hypothetical protein
MIPLSAVHATRLLPLVFLALVACGRQEPPPPAAATAAPGTPPAAAAAPAPVPKPADVSITGVHTGLGIDRYQRVKEEKNSFAGKDGVVVSVYSDGSARTARIRVKWLGPDGRTLAENTQEVVYNGSQATAFSLEKSEGLPPGAYRAEVYLNDWLAETARFEVR